MSSVRTIARKAGVSITTVSRVLNNHPQVSDEVRQRVLNETSRSGYVPSVGRKSTTNIALLYTGENSLCSPFDGAILFGMSQGMEEQGYDLMVLDARRSRNAGESFSQMLMRKGVRGCVVRTTSQTRGIVEQLADEGVPFVVAADRFQEDERVNYVYSDSSSASRDAVEHLIGLGHTRIAIGTNMIDDSDHDDRMNGYRAALDAHGIPFSERMVLRTPANREGGMQLLRRVTTHPDRPTALFMADPMAAVGLLFEARRMKVSIPDEISVVGFDDADVRYMVSPELTAVCQDAIALGREAFTALHGMLEGDRSVVTRKALQTWLEIHASTAAPAKA